MDALIALLLYRADSHSYCEVMNLTWIRPFFLSVSLCVDKIKMLFLPSPFHVNLCSWAEK